MSALPPLIKALLQPEAHRGEAERVELLQTHISYVLLAGDYAYKVKKPVNFGFLDFTTLEKRRRYCQEEVRLNRRLSPDMYLGTVRITQERGSFSIEGKGETVEYAVKMKRLPQERMLNELLKRGEASREMMSRVAEKLSDFHSSARTNRRIASFGRTKAVRMNIDENFHQVRKYIDITIPEERYEAIKAYAYGFMEMKAPIFDRRVEGGRIKDCHGDLHSASICIANGIYIFDCIEFNERFRFCDVASDMAFLLMDLEFHGRKDLSDYLLEVYQERMKDEELPRLLPFYKCYRAYVRGKVGSLSLDDPHLPEAERLAALEKAKRYFDLAFSYTSPPKPALFITVGLVGTGKTTLAEGLAKRMGLVFISSDVVRKELAGISPQEHRLEGFEEGIYSREFSRLTYGEMFRRARGLLREGHPVILDASFLRREDRRNAMKLAEEAGVDFRAVECLSSEMLVRERLERRLQEGYSPSDGRWEIYLEQKRVLEPLTEVPVEAHVILDTSGPGEEVLERAVVMISAKQLSQRSY